MAETDMDQLRQYYDTHDTAPELETALSEGRVAYEDDVVENPMVTTSLRLPRSVLQDLRAMASRERVKTTALMRRLLEDALNTDTQAHITALEHTVAQLRSDVDELARHMPHAA